jgi:hypothetical protein
MSALVEKLPSRPAPRAVSPAGIAILAGATAFALSAESGSGRPLPATYQATCAPTDGPAFQIAIPLAAEPSTLHIRVDQPLEQSRGTWTIGAEPHRADVTLCSTKPRALCTNATSGTFTISLPKDGQFGGTVEATFVRPGPQKHTVRLRYSAPEQPLPYPPMFCG